jgi:hypothetical protein
MKPGISRGPSYLTLSMLAAIIATSAMLVSIRQTECESARLNALGLTARAFDAPCIGTATHFTASTQLTPYTAGCPEFADESNAELLTLRITRIKHELSLDDLWLEPNSFVSSAGHSKNGLSRWHSLRDIPSYDALLLPSVRLQV